VSRAFLVARNAEEKATAVENRFAHQRRLAVLSVAPGSTAKSSLSFADTLEASEESAMFGTPDEIAKKLSALRAGGIEHVLLNGPAGSRDNLRSFARDIMPAFAGVSKGRTESRERPALVNS
jgi:alkanesulfonate monooxygenase SsuD/methylene tetrahydromethanopterin reductase-like flavin-dependent oxidoreductase (luciferase family)